MRIAIRKTLQVLLFCESEDEQIVECIYLAGRSADKGSIPGRGKRFFPLTSVSRPALGSTQPPVQLVPGVLSPGAKRGRGVMLTTHTI
jgi:hypothetical protein